MTTCVTVDEISTNQHGESIATLVAGDGALLTLPAALLPAGARVGDVLRLTLEPDPEETDRRRSASSQLQRELFG